MQSSSQPESTQATPAPRRWIRILAVILGVAPVYSLAIYMHLTAERTYTASEMILFPLTFGVGTILIIVLLQKLFCRERLAALNSGKGNWLTDIAWGIGLLVILIVLTVVEQFTIYRWLPFRGGQFDDLLFSMLENPLMLVLWFGPVVWVGIAIFEELTRVFMLRHLGGIWTAQWAQWGVVILAAAVFAAGHLYQGPAGMVGNFISGLVTGALYIRLRRFWPLVIAHALYDTAWIVFGLVQVQRATG